MLTAELGMVLPICLIQHHSSFVTAVSLSPAATATITASQTRYCCCINTEQHHTMESELLLVVPHQESHLLHHTSKCCLHMT